MAARSKAKVFGPFPIENKTGGEVITFLSMPFGQVLDSQVIVSIADNSVASIVAADQTNEAYGIVVVEIGAFGSVQGYETLLKRQQVRSFWGPFNLILGARDSYDQFFLRARLFFGGKPGRPTDLVLATDAAGHSIPLIVKATVHVQPREGIG